MTASEVEEAIFSYFGWHKRTLLPHWTPVSWWECDVVEITASKYLIEYEIKVSRGDFLADARKQKSLGFGSGQKNKHALLRAKDPRGPSRFWFVVPRGLVKPEEVPEFAGLLYADDRTHLSVARPAPRLHKTKISDQTMQAIFRTCYWRFHHERQIRRKLERAAKH